MHSLRLFTAAVASLLGAQGVLGTKHGEVAEFDGKNFRWQEVAEGFFTGIPEEEWDDKLHKRANVEWDLSEILTNSSSSTSADTSQPVSRDLVDQCRVGAQCVVRTTTKYLRLGWDSWLSAAAYAAGPAGDLWEQLNKPFLANTGGVAIAGIISGQTNEALKKDCSSASPGDRDIDILRSALNIAIDKENPDAQEVSVNITGPNGSSTLVLKVRADSLGTTPAITCK